MLRRVLMAGGVPPVPPVAGPEIRDTRTSLSAVPAAAQVLDLPSYEVGDLVVLFVSFRRNSGGPTPVTPAGWTLQQIGAITPAAFYSFYRVMSSGDGSTVTIGTAASVSSACIATSIKSGTYSVSHLASGYNQITGGASRDAPAIAALPFTGRSALILAGCGTNGAAMPTAWPFVDGRTHVSTGGASALPTRCMLCHDTQDTAAVYGGPYSFAANANIMTISVAVGAADA